MDVLYDNQCQQGLIIMYVFIMMIHIRNPWFDHDLSTGRLLVAMHASSGRVQLITYLILLGLGMDGFTIHLKVKKGIIAREQFQV